MVTPTALQPTPPAADGSPSRGYDRITSLTPRGVAVLAILRAQDLVRELDAADREYLAPYAAELLVDCTTDLPPTA